MGYVNLSKGASNIALWERGEDLPRDAQKTHIIKALPKTAPLLEAALKAQLAETQAREEAQSKMCAWEDRARGEEASLVFTYSSTLSKLLSTPEGRAFQYTPLPFSALNLAYIGGRILTLGELIQAWAQGQLKAPCPCHSEPMPVFRIAGSPLSGVHSLRALCTISGEVVSTQHREKTLLAFVEPLLKCSAPKGLSAPCLEQALKACGITPPPIECTDAAGSPIATWYPSTSELKDDKGLNLSLSTPAQDSSIWRDEVGRCRYQGVPVIRSLVPLGFGAWRGARFMVKVDTHRHFHATSGHMHDDKDHVCLRWRRIPPPRVIMRLAQDIAIDGEPG